MRLGGCPPVPGTDNSERPMEPGSGVADRVRRGLPFWRSIAHPHTDRRVLDWVENGYQMEWGPEGPAPPSSTPNQPPAQAHAGFVDEQVRDMLATGAIALEVHQPRVVSPLSVVPKANGKFRLILDLRRVNGFLAGASFRMESLTALTEIASRGDYMISLDQTQGYYHVSMHRAAHQYMGFAWRGRYYTFRVLPFGLATAPRCFAKVMGVLVRHWRQQGVRMLAYLDDWLFVAASPGEARLLADKVLRDCALAHIAVNQGKSQLDPVQRLQHLGFLVDLQAGTFAVPVPRWEALQAGIAALLAAPRAPIHRLARVAGQLVSMGLALGPVTRLFTRGMYADIDTASCWGQWVSLSPGTLAELRFWQGTSRGDFTQPIWPPQYSQPPVHMECDASGIGWGGLVAPCVSAAPTAIAHGFFRPWERAASSTLRELKGLLYTIQSFLAKCANRRVRIQVDNQNLLAVVWKGSRVAAMTELAQELFWLCLKWGILLQVVWVPRTENARADAISNFSDTDDWQLNPSMFADMDERWGPHQVDRFATHLNWLCPTFWSRHWCPGTQGIDSFSVSWTGVVNWINPPFGLIGRAIRKLRAEEAVATVVVPFWRGRHWWCLVAPDGSHLSEFVADWVWLPSVQDTFLPGERSGNHTPQNAPGWRVMAIHFDFRGTGGFLPRRARCVHPPGTCWQCQ
jgi:hypothetical protein